MYQPMDRTMSIPINMRKWLIERFIQQKNKEHDAMENERRKAQSNVKKK